MYHTFRHGAHVFTINRQTEITRENAREFLTNMVQQIINGRLVRTVQQGEKWKVVQATLRHAEHNPTPPRYVWNLMTVTLWTLPIGGYAIKIG